MPMMFGLLKALDYGREFYEEHRDAGLDYLVYGRWQASYALMVSEVTDQRSSDPAVVFDAGCACGSILKGFRDTGLFQNVVGIDLSAHMVSLGRAEFGFSESQLRVGSIAETGLESASVSLVHSSQVLEHIPHEMAPQVIAEFARILRPGGRAFLALDAVRAGESAERYMGDPTHVNVQPVLYWTQLIHDAGLLFDVEAYNRFVRSPRGPFDDVNSFYREYPDWSVWTLIKP